MEMRQVRGFLALAEFLNFHRAAQHIRVTQPALSRQIKLLEEEVGVRLVERDRHGAALTYAGGVLRDALRDLVARSDYAAERAQRAAQGMTGLLRVGFISTAVTANVLSPLISRFRDAYRQTELVLQNLATSDQIRMLEESTLDVGLLRLPVTASGRIEMITIHAEPLVVILPNSHPLAMEENLSLEDLENSPFIMYARRRAPGYHDLIMRIINDHGFSPMIFQEAGEMYTLVSMVSAGFGVAISPLSIQSYHLPGLIVRRIPALPDAEIAIAFRRDNAASLCGGLVEIARQLSGTTAGAGGGPARGRE